MTPTHPTAAMPLASGPAFEVARGEIRAALAAVLPHAGRETEDTPVLGRVRLHLTGDALLIWATDHRTAALARVEDPDFITDELATWDLPVDAVAKALKVFKAPTNADARAMWADQPMRIEVTDAKTTLTEVGSLIDGQSLTVTRIMPAGEDRYPDVPRALLALADAVKPDPGVRARVDPDALSRFVAAARGYSGAVPILTVLPGFATHQVLVRIGQSVIGSAPAYPDVRQSPADVLIEETAQHQWWSDLLGPLRRPLPVRLSTAATDDLTRQATELLRTAGHDVGLRVVPALPDEDA
ncbi:hypothetical protein [Cellulomonas timonensis]|uniref:hypothetical protein n=1 Tax=Cellulomonas timonensis TaxID=1689271 RepID=UPI000833DA84|nr:hypothetical protein [Cellulomonas timonensis]